MHFKTIITAPFVKTLWLGWEAPTPRANDHDRRQLLAELYIHLDVYWHATQIIQVVN